MRTRNCAETTTSGRLRKAVQFMEQAENVRDLADDDAEVGDTFVSLCVLAGIEDLAKSLGALLTIKTKAAYSDRAVSAEDRKRAERSAARLVEAARDRA